MTFFRIHLIACFVSVRTGCTSIFNDGNGFSGGIFFRKIRTWGLILPVFTWARLWKQLLQGIFYGSSQLLCSAANVGQGGRDILVNLDRGDRVRLQILSQLRVRHRPIFNEQNVSNTNGQRSAHGIFKIFS